MKWIQIPSYKWIIHEILDHGFSTLILSWHCQRPQNIARHRSKDFWGVFITEWSACLPTLEDGPCKEFSFCRSDTVSICWYWTQQGTRLDYTIPCCSLNNLSCFQLASEKLMFCSWVAAAEVGHSYISTLDARLRHERQDAWPGIPHFWLVGSGPMNSVYHAESQTRFFKLDQHQSYRSCNHTVYHFHRFWWLCTSNK